MEPESDRSSYKDSHFIIRRNINGKMQQKQRGYQPAGLDSNGSSSTEEKKGNEDRTSFRDAGAASSDNITQTHKFEQINARDSDYDDYDNYDDDDNQNSKHHRTANHLEMNVNEINISDDYNDGDDENEEIDDDTDNNDDDLDDDDEGNMDIIDNRISYELLQWIFIILFTLIAVIDRFTINLWPLWVDSPGPTIPGNFSVTCFSLISWISSRMLLVSSSYIFLFQNRVFWNWFVEIPIINKYISIGDIHQINNRIHYYVGIYFIGIPVLLHVWSIIFAVIFPQNPPNEMKLYFEWMRPNDPISGNSIPFYSNNLLSLGLNDLYRIISTSITFFILIPYSIIKCLQNSISWSFAQYIHLFGGIIYTVDLIRMYSHPHCWVFNLPFIFWWILDRIYGIFYYRRCVAKIVKKIHLDQQYLILYLRIPHKYYLLHSIGDVFYFNILDNGWDRSHPFTVFYNHKNMKKMITDDQLNKNWNGHKFSIYNDKHYDDNEQSQYIMSRQSTVFDNDFVDDYDLDLDECSDEDNKHHSDSDCDWNLGIIMQIIPHHTNTNCYHRKTWTSGISQIDQRLFCGLRTWGPYRSEYRILINQYMVTPIVLIGTGAGCSLLVDFYHYITNNNIKLTKSVQFYFSTRSIAMFQWFTDITCNQNINNLFVNAHLTNHDNIIYNKKSIKKTRDSNIGRLNIEEILNKATKNTNVFFCGSPNVQKMIANLCKKLSLTYHAGHSF